jgi:hypothetical protein
MTPTSSETSHEHLVGVGEDPVFVFIFAVAAGVAEAGFNGGYGAQDVKQQGVGGNFEVEVHQAVDQDSGDADHGG